MQICAHPTSVNLTEEQPLYSIGSHGIPWVNLGHPKSGLLDLGRAMFASVQVKKSQCLTHGTRFFFCEAATCVGAIPAVEPCFPDLSLSGFPWLRRGHGWPISGMRYNI